MQYFIIIQNNIITLYHLIIQQPGKTKKIYFNIVTNYGSVPPS